MIKITIIHTSLVSHAHLNQLFREIIPEAKIHNIVDDSLLAEVNRWHCPFFWTVNVQ